MKRKNIILVGIALAILLLSRVSFNNKPQPSNIDTKQIQNASIYINDISAASLYNPLEKKGFKIDKQTGSDGIFVDCDRSLPELNEHVRIAGDAFDKIVEIRASYTNQSSGDTNELAIRFLAFIATLPYTNSNPEQAKNWVVENISKDSKIEINGVSFEMFANSNNLRTLLITPTTK